MFRFIAGMFSHDMAIDLGTANSVISIKGKGIVIDEPSVVAIKRVKNGEYRVVSIGKEAKSMLGKSPKEIEVIRPIRDGVVANFDMATKMIKHFIQKAHLRTMLVSPRAVICVPYGLTALERNSVTQIAKEAGIREVYLIEESIAAAIGEDIDISLAQGHLIVDIGGGTTEIGVVSLGGLVTSKSIKVAGDKLDLAIVDFVRKRFNLEITQNLAEVIKINLATATAEYDKKVIKITGKAVMKQNLSSVKITSYDIHEAIKPRLKEIISSVKYVIEYAPVDIASDIIDNGVLLTGGGALIKNIDMLVSQKLKLSAYIADSPLLSVAKGTAKALENIDYLKTLDKY